MILFKLFMLFNYAIRPLMIVLHSRLATMLSASEIASDSQRVYKRAHCSRSVIYPSTVQQEERGILRLRYDLVG